MSEITTANANCMNTFHGQLQVLQQKFSALGIESHAEEIFRPPSSIMGGRNEQANVRSINKSGDRSICKVSVQISS